MAEHHLELTIKGILDDAILDALLTAGCDDATVSSKGDLIFAEFDREAPNMLAAVISAIDQVESDGLEVLHVDLDELVWVSEIAQRVGRTRQSVDQLIKGQRGPGGFLSPVAHATRNPLWRWSEVDAWWPPTKTASRLASACSCSAPSTAPSRLATVLRGSRDAIPLREAPRAPHGVVGRPAKTASSSGG